MIWIMHNSSNFVDCDRTTDTDHNHHMFCSLWIFSALNNCWDTNKCVRRIMVQFANFMVLANNTEFDTLISQCIFLIPLNHLVTLNNLSDMNEQHSWPKHKKVWTARIIIETYCVNSDWVRYVQRPGSIWSVALVDNHQITGRPCRHHEANK